MTDVDINKFRASVVREGSKPASPGFIVSEGQSPTDPAGSGQNHLPVTITTVATGLSITESQVLGGAGTVGQYIRGDGSLADFPESSGGGSSVSYYLNGSESQGTIGGVAYKELNKVPILGAGTDFTINADGYIASFLTDAGDPNLLEIPGGNWNFETYFSASSSGGTPTFYVELYKYNGTTFTLIASSSTAPEFIAFGTTLTPYFSSLAVPTTTLALTDRLAVRYYVTHSGRTITLHTENNHLCQIITTFTTGITALNGLTAQVQNFAVGTSGTDFAIASATATHTFNLPTASATNRGALSSADWTTFNNKTSNLGTVTSVGLSSATSGVTIGSSPVTTSGTITLAIATASGSQNGLLSSTDWSTFNGKQNALTNPVTGTGDSGTLPKFTGASTIGNSLFTDNGTNGAFGGANYYSGTDVRTFNVSAPLYPGIGFFANNVNTGNIFSYSVTGNLILNADPSNVFGDTRIILATDSVDRFAIFNDGNVTIANSPINESFKLYVSGTGKFSSNLTANSFIKIGGTSSQFLKADGSVDSTTYVPTSRTITINGTSQDLSANRTYNVGTVTSVTASSPLFSSGGNTPNITIQQASGSQNGFLSSTDWTTFNNKAPSVAGGYLPLSGGTLTGTTTMQGAIASLVLKSDGAGVPLYLWARTSDDSSAIFFYNNAGGTLQNYIQSLPTDFRIISQQNAPISFTTNAASSTIADMSITADGNVNISNGNLVIGTAGKGIDFSQTTNGSGTTTSELLNDYEEGTFTPTIIYSTSNTPTYYGGGQLGRYTKIGRIVQVQIYLNWNENGSTGNISLGGLPFTSINSQPRAAASIVSFGFVGISSSIIGFVNTNSTTMTLAINDNNLSSLTAANTDNDQDLYVTLVYEVV